MGRWVRRWGETWESGAEMGSAGLMLRQKSAYDAQSDATSSVSSRVPRKSLHDVAKGRRREERFDFTHGKRQHQDGDRQRVPQLAECDHPRHREIADERDTERRTNGSVVRRHARKASTHKRSETERP